MGGGSTRQCSFHHEGLLMLVSYIPNSTEIQLILRHDDGHSADASAFACVRYQHDPSHPSLLGGLEMGVSPA